MINNINKLAVAGRFTVFLSILFCLCFDSYGQNTFVKHFTTKEGLPSNNCYYTLQDKNGYIWISSDAGVSRFDGNMFENFSVDDGLPDNQIIQMNQDKKGKIWFSALNGQLSYFFNGKIYNEHNDKLLRLLKFNGVVVSFFEDSKGNMWFGTNKNLLAKWDGHLLTRYSSSNSKNQFINTFVYEDKTGTIWASSAHCLRIFNGSKFTLTKKTVAPLSYKTSLNRAGKTMLFLDRNGLNIKDGNTEKLTIRIEEKILNENPGYFYAENDQGVWLSTNTGVYQIEKEKTTRYLHQISTNQVIKDAQGNMWFTTSNGIYFLPKKENRIYILDAAQGLSNNNIKSLTKDNKNALWLGLGGGMINQLQYPGAPVKKINLPDKIKYQQIKQLGFDTACQNLFFASDNGMGVVKNPNGKNPEIDYLRETSNSGFVLKSFSISKNNKLAISLSSGVVIIDTPLNNFNFSSSAYEEGKNFFSGRSYHVYYDIKQNLWFSSVKGLSELCTDRLNKRYEQHPLLTKRINDIKQAADGTTVLATDGYGLLFFKNNKLVKQLTIKDGLANNICKSIFIRDGQVWVMTNSGLNRIRTNKNYAVESFEYTNTMLHDDVNGLYIDRDTAYFATNHGLVYFPIDRYDSRNASPKVLISAIISNRLSLTQRPGNIILSPDHNNIIFYYSAIDFENKTILYRYRLKSNGNWTETKNRRIEFSSLEPGKYTFELCAKTTNSSWSKPVDVKFTLIEHFWQSTYFILLLILLASITFYKIAVIITRQQKNKEQQQLLYKNKILMLEQRALQAMMNPHFVFNVMNSIQHYINTKDTSSANKILTGFAKLIRKNLDICTRSFITLEEELDYLNLYLNLEKKRFGEKFNYYFEIDETIDQDETLLPSMLLQPYIENAIWHGLMPQEEGGEIKILITKADNQAMLIRIIDNGVGFDNSIKIKKDSHDSRGMSLTQERIHLINQTEVNPIQIEVAQNGNSGTIISILIPFK